MVYRFSKNKKMKSFKKIIIFFGFLLFVILIGMIAIPYLYKDQVIAYVKEEANKTINAQVDFQDVSLSLFRNFPSLTVQLQEVTVDGIAAFEGVRLFEGATVGATLDVLDAFYAKDNFPIQSVVFKQPKVHLLVLPDGKANWDILKESDEASSDYLVKLQQYSVENGVFLYEDRDMDLQLDWKDINHTGSGQFSSNIFDLTTLTHVGNLNATYEGVDYLQKATATLDALLNINVTDLKITLKENELLLNALKLNAEGSIDINDEDYDIDLAFQSPQSDFKSLWSVLPGAYTKDFDKANIAGKMDFSGIVKGKYSDTRYPAFKIQTNVTKGLVKYPDLPAGIQEIFVNATINSPTSNLNDIQVDIPTFSMLLNQQPVKGKFHLSKPMTDPTVDGFLQGDIDLALVGKAVPLEGVQVLKGKVLADVTFDAAQSQLEQKQYDQVKVAGHISMDGVQYQATNQPLITFNHVKTNFSPKKIELQSINAKLGDSDLQAKGYIDNILAYFHPDQQMVGSFQFSSNYFNANEWLTTEDTTTLSASTTTASTKPFDQYQFEVDGFIHKMDYLDYPLTDIKMVGRVSPTEVVIKEGSTRIQNSDLTMSGTVNNWMNYLFEQGVLVGDLAIQSNFLNLNQFMETAPTATASTAAVEVLPIPKNVDLQIEADLKKVQYSTIDLTHVHGQLAVQEEVANLDKVKAKVLNGGIALSGSYGTKDLAAPTFAIDYEVTDIDFNKAFKTFNTYQLIAPLGRFLEGTFTSNLKLNGTLGKDFIPNLATLNLQGFLHTFNTTIRNSPVFEKLADKLQIQALKNVQLKDSKNWVEIKNGYVELEETHFTVDKEMLLSVKGRHHLLQEECYSW